MGKDHPDGELGVDNIWDNLDVDTKNKLIHAVVIQMTIDEDIEVVKNGFDELFRMARRDYCPAIASVGLYYVLDGELNNSQDSLLLGKRLTVSASDRGDETAKKTIQDHPMINDVIDDGRPLDYPSPAGEPLDIRAVFVDINDHDVGS